MNIIRKSYDKKVFLTAFLATFIIHGARIFNVLCWHDDVKYIFRGWNTGLRHGRWLHHIMATIIEYTSGHEILPVFSGIVSALCIGLIACLLLDLFEIKEYWLQFPLILIFCAIPSVTGHFGYIGSAGYDFVGKLLCAAGAYILCKGIEGKKGVLSFELGALLFACSLGEYQCYVPFYLTILLIYFTKEILKAHNTWKEFFVKAIYYVGSSVVGLVLYLVILKLFLYAAGTELTSYAGTDTFGVVNISTYIERVIFAYQDFFVPHMNEPYNMFPFHWDGWHAGLLFGLFGLMLLNLVLKVIKKEYNGAVQSIIAFILLPLGLNFNFIVYGAEATHSLHMYHYILLFLYLFVLAEVISEQIFFVSSKDTVKQALIKGICGITAVVVLIFGVLYIRYDNYCYMQAEVRQEKAISYFTTLITRIQSVDGYDDDYPIAFMNADQKKNSIDEITDRFDPIVTNPYSYPIVNSYDWEDYIRLWCGFEPSYADPSEYFDNEIVQEMPSYPDDGSIQVMDGVVVVKF